MQASMFRVKLQVPNELVKPYIERIKTGVRGMGYVRLDDTVAWPEFLEASLSQTLTPGALMASVYEYQYEHAGCHGDRTSPTGTARHGWLDAVTAEIPSGCMVGLIGPDGVGKSTLMGLIAGAKKIQSGKVHVLGGDMASARHRTAVCPRIAYMPQGLGKNLYLELSVYENIDFFAQLFGLRLARNAARRIPAAPEGPRALGPFPDRRGGEALGRHEAEGRALFRR